MGDIVKWGLLVAGALIIIALIVALPFNQFINLEEFSQSLSVVVETCGDYFETARGLVNNFLTPFGRTLLTGILFYLVAKFFIVNTIKLVVWIYHFIFK